jgi:tetratricopeptide (TPR) repeat protein
MESRTSRLNQLNDSHLSPDERTRLRCHLAKGLEDAGKYEEALGVFGDLWPRPGERPLIDGLDRGTAAQVLLRAGALLGWIGKAKQIAGAQEAAKDLISESIEIYESLCEAEKVAEARSDLSVCYWREGLYDEAQIILRNALDRLSQDKDQRALARLSHTEQALSTLRRALESAARMDDVYRAGLSALTIVEELGNFLTVAEMLAFYEQADDKLAQAQQPETTERLRLCARRVLDAGRDLLLAAADGEKHSSHATDALAQPLTRTPLDDGEWQGCSLEDEVLRYEGSLIRLALNTARGRITQAARLLGITHQGLAYILQGRHKSLLASRKPPKTRRRSIVNVVPKQRV